MKLRGFTLAEVLITLMIIGIVAALTIPSVISNYQQQEFKTGLKKAVSVLNEAIQTNISQEAETPYENSDMFNYFQRHMSILKTKYEDNSAKLNSNRSFYTVDGMRFEFPFMNQGTMTYKDGVLTVSNGMGSMGAKVNGKFILHESGLNVLMQNDDPKATLGCYTASNMFGGGTYQSCSRNSHSSLGYCGSLGLASNHNNTINTPCVIIVDVNGDRKPNPAGDPQYEYWANGDISSSTYPEYIYPAPADKKITDVFPILITDEKAIPFGVVAQRAMYSK